VLLLANEDQPAICDDALDEKQQHNDEKNLLLRDESADLEDRESTSEGYGSSGLFFSNLLSPNFL
jgi:hypothetical protein